MEYVAIQCPGDDPPCRLPGLVALTARLIDELALTAATIDGFSDCGDLPVDAAKALARLDQVSTASQEGDATRFRWLRRKEPTNMALQFDLSTPARRVVEAFAPYSIHAELRDRWGLIELVLHDSGTAVSISTDLATDDTLVGRVLDEAMVAYHSS